MDAGTELPREALFSLFALLLYLPVCLAVFRWLFPRLSAFSRRLAGAMLLAQALLIVISLWLRPSMGIEEWLWDLDLEWNIPSALASAQLALAAGLTLAAGARARAQSRWRRAYLLGISLVFLLLALEEFYSWKSSIPDWRNRYLLLGAATAGATLLLAARSSWRARLWLFCLLTGLALLALGGIVFDRLPAFCLRLEFLQLRGCMGMTKVPDELLEALGSWLALVAALGLFSDAAPAASRHWQRALLALAALWFCWHAHFALLPTLEFWLTVPRASAQFEDGIELIGYRMFGDAAALSGELYFAALPAEYAGLGYSITLLDQASQAPLASLDADAERRSGIWPQRKGGRQVYREAFALHQPQPPAPNRALWLLLTVWRREGAEFLSRPLISSERPLLDETSLILQELLLPAASAPAATSTPLARFDNGFMLQMPPLPASAQAGRDLALEFSWGSAAAGEEDHAQFLHFGHEASGAWWVFDAPPLGARLPTRLWYSGLSESETWQVPLPAELAPGRYQVFTGLYRMRDKERVPAADAQGQPFLDARIPLGSLIISNS